MKARRETLSIKKRYVSEGGSVSHKKIQLVMIKALPYLLLLVGLIALFLVGNVYAAGVFITIGIVIILERVWPSVSDD